MKIAIGNDHAAVEMKEAIKAHLEGRGILVEDMGTNTCDSCDYPVYGEKVGRAVASGEADLGIVICGTGVGISMAANKVKGIRACVCSEPCTARLSRMHNDSNVLCLGGQVTGILEALDMVDIWLNTEFEGGRHCISLGLIAEIEDTLLTMPEGGDSVMEPGK